MAVEAELNDDNTSGQHSSNQLTPQLLEKPYEAPAEAKNPVLRGLPLRAGASLVSSVSAVSSYLWTNAGFTVLRNLPELDQYPPRYDPTVTPFVASPQPLSSLSALSSPDLASRSPPSTAPARFPSIADYHAAYSSGGLTPVDVAEALLPLVRRDVSKRTDHATAFVQTNVAAVRAAAEASTERWKAGKALGLLDGVPIAIKDEVDVEGYERKVGTNHLFETKGTSWCVKAMIDAGAIVIGKSTMHELGLDTTNNNPNHGTPLNPYNKNYYCGGSSGGSAYAVGAGLVPLALGADGGGSIRIPSSFCGAFGLKTSHGRISRLPTSNAAISTGVIGPMAANMLDLEVGFRVMSVPDSALPSSAHFPPPQPAPRPPTTKLLGLYQPWFDRADPLVRDSCNTALAYLQTTLGYRTVPITIPYLSQGQVAHALTILSEIATSQPSVKGLTPANQILISVGAHTPARDFLLAQKLRELLMRHLAAIFRQHPGLVVVTPTTPLPGWRIAGGAADLRYGVSDANTSVRNMEFVWLANLCGCPCLQVPVGYVDAVGGGGKVPVGMMGMGEWGKDEDLIGFGYDAEKWLHEGLEGGRQMPENWVDVLGLAKKGSE
ncbi:MAG: hypothetical protein M1821_007003 [Bathelium mastoideum]|nr:MAG: hypothetical protein M1821_007003 [Bathelium mastoideum]